jgi:hypothetical protein
VVLVECLEVFVEICEIYSLRYNWLNYLKFFRQRRILVCGCALFYLPTVLFW